MLTIIFRNASDEATSITGSDITYKVTSKSTLIGLAMVDRNRRQFGPAVTFKSAISEEVALNLCFDEVTNTLSQRGNTGVYDFRPAQEQNIKQLAQKTL